MVSFARVRGKGQVTLPENIRRAVKLAEGDYLEVSVSRGTILMRPRKLIDADQAWFWTQDWQHGEREATEDITKGRTRRFGSAKEFLHTHDE
jgi:AbrB family looped-hinge helix DNA binding protein